MAKAKKGTTKKGATKQAASKQAATKGGAEEAATETHFAKWTIMIYMAGDNNLADDSIRALTEAREERTFDDIHVVAQIDPSDPRMPTCRLVLNLDDKEKSPVALRRHSSRRPGNAGPRPRAGVLGFDIINGLPPGDVPFDDEKSSESARGAETPATDETDTADPITLFNFISWVVSNCPAEHYMLVLAGHAAGVETGFLLKDDNPPGSMKFSQLVDVLRRTHEKLGVKLDILGLDACLMNMVEICYELQPHVEYLVGTQSFVPDPGWPYKRIVRELKGKVKRGLADPEEMAKTIIYNYVNSYLENAVLGGLSIDLSALRLADSVGVAAALKKLATALCARLTTKEQPPYLTREQQAVVLAHWSAQSYNGELYVDLCDFCELLETYYFASGVTDDELRAALAEVKTAVQRMVLLSCFCGIDFQYSNGVSIYFPWSVLIKGYKDLAFAVEGGSDWFAFLKTYLNKTRRQPRGTYDAADPAAAKPLEVGRSFVVDVAPFGRKAPPEGHGPSGIVHSMRNPPNAWSEGNQKVRGCISGRNQERLEALFSEIQNAPRPTSAE